MTRLLVVTIALAGVVAAWPAAGAPVQAQVVGADGPIELVLEDQRFEIAAREPWPIRFRLDGSLDGVLPVPATSTPSTPSSSPPTSAATPAAIEPADVRVTLYRPIDDRNELAETLSGQRPTVVDTLTVPLAGVASTTGGTTTISLELPTSTDTNVGEALTMRRPGLYPAAVQVVQDGEVLAEHLTFVERRAIDPPPIAPMNVSLLAAVDDPGPRPDAEEVARARRDLAAVAELTAAVEAPVTIAVPPGLLTGLADEDPELDEAFQASLDGDELLSLPAEELDPSSAVAAGREEAFVRTLRDGEDALSAALPGIPATRSAWLAASPVSTAAARTLRGLGFDLLVLDEDVYDRLDGTIATYHDTSLVVDVDLGDGSTMPGMVPHRSAALLDRDRSVAPAPTDAAVRLLTELIVARRELGAGARRSVILAAPDLEVPDPAVAAAFASLAADVDDLRLTTLSALPSTTDTMEVNGEPQVVALPDRAGPDLAARAERIDLTRVSAESAGSMQLATDDLTRWTSELDSLLSTGLDDETVEVALARISTEAQAVRDAVVAPRPFDFTLTGRSSTLRLNFQNNADERLRIVVRARSPKLTFPNGDQPVVLEPGGRTEVLIPVEARSNGTSSIEVDVLTPNLSVAVGRPVVLTANVNALTGLGQVITGGALLVLVSWWYGHFRRRRRQRLARLAAADIAALLDETDRLSIPGSEDSPEAAPSRPGP